MNVHRLILGFVPVLWAALGVLGAPAGAFAAGPPVIEEEASVLNVSSTSATLSAQINPGGVSTTYRFEYDTSAYDSNARHGESQPSPEGSVGEASGPVTVQVHLQGLTAATLYHFRVIATNSVGETAYAPDQTLTTQPSGSEFALPDGRSWEMVSPPNKRGAAIHPLSFFGPVQASETGTKVTYLATAPVYEEPEEPKSNESPVLTQVFSRRNSTGWSSQDIDTPDNVASRFIEGHFQEYQLFSNDLSAGIVEPQQGTLLSSEASEATIYRRNDETCETTPTTCYIPLVTDASGHANVELEPGAKFGRLFPEGITFDAATPDLNYVVLRSPVALKSNAGEFGLYEWADGNLRVIGVLPNDSMFHGEPLLGHADENVRHAISNNGSRIIWSTSSNFGQLYLRDMTKGETIQLDAPQPKSLPITEEDPMFQTASADGEKIFFTDRDKLVSGSKASFQEPELYEFEVASGSGPLGGSLTDLTTATDHSESADVEGTIPGASDDGNYVYVVARGVLAQNENGEKEEAQQGAPNLYLIRHGASGWTTTFIAVLSPDDERDWSSRLSGMTTRVSSNGRYLAFMSDKSLTGYDNRDAGSGERDEEVYLYDAQAEQEGRQPLVCASCDPTGARPTGVFDPGGFALQVDQSNIWSSRWLAATIPTWTAISLSKTSYQSRYLSDSGRLFFNSTDALVPSDINGEEDVYEYEPPTGVESAPPNDTCTFASPIHAFHSDGCVALISSGTSDLESSFLDASETGNDVFFLTAEKLVPRDQDTTYDVYDAQVCSSESPCATEPPLPPPCATTDSCRGAPRQQPSVFGAPPSATFSGQADLTAPGPRLAVKPKSLTRRQKLARALNNCRKQRNRKRRVACKRQARKRYGAKSARKAKSNRRGRR
ncbi:MAG: fibronectin type III domain-containing protein [Solirubrobacteraceae bacterium]